MSWRDALAAGRAPAPAVERIDDERGRGAR
jgi:hypothetical protein